MNRKTFGLLLLSVGGLPCLAAPQEPPPSAPVAPPPSTPPTAKTPPKIAAASKPDPLADLKRRLLRLEQENARLRGEVSQLRTQVNGLTTSYNSHYHQVNGKVGDGLVFMDGKTLVTGRYADTDLRKTNAPQPAYRPPVAASVPTKSTAPKPGAKPPIPSPPRKPS